MAVGAVLVAWSVWTMLGDRAECESYEELAETASPLLEEQQGSDDSWEDVQGISDAVCAWLRVDGTSVDLPVVAATEERPDWYLKHDLWGNWTEIGNPYMDWRCEPDSSAVVVYGHHTSYSNYMFHDLAECFRQERLDALGELTWSTPAGATETYEPLCSSKVQTTDGTWQRYGDMARKDLRKWLVEALPSADAKAASAEWMAEHADRAIVLVTCSGYQTYGKSWRTVTVFVQAAEEKETGNE